MIIEFHDEKSDNVQKCNIVFSKMEEINLDTGDKVRVHREEIGKGAVRKPCVLITYYLVFF